MSEPYDSHGLLGGHFIVMAQQMVDSESETTRIFWRKRYFEASEDEARDPGPFADVLRERQNAHKT